MTADPRVLSGRRKEAALNDVRILKAARSVFMADPGAPIAAVAHEAGVGISALYRRFKSKEDLLQQLCLEGLQQYMAVAEAALSDTTSPWDSFCRFMDGIVQINTHALTIRVAGTFPPNDELYRLAMVGQDLNVKIFERAESAGCIRNGVKVDDVNLIFEQLAAIMIGDERRNLQLRRRYLKVFLDGLHISAGDDLPGPAPTWSEISKRWDL